LWLASHQKSFSDYFAGNQIDHLIFLEFITEFDNLKSKMVTLTALDIFIYRSKVGSKHIQKIFY
jgi:hypothetical protein